MGKIIHGNSNFGFAKIDTTNPQAPTFTTPIMIPGMVSATIEVEQEDTKVYADNRVYCNVKGAKVRTATVAFRNIPKEYAEMLGFKENTNGMLSDTGEFPSHCIFFETEEEDCETGTTSPTLHYLYNVIGSEPTKESQTDEEEVEPAEIEVEYSANDSSFVVDEDGKYLQYGYIKRTNENASLYDTFKSAIILPTSDIPASV